MLETWTGIKLILWYSCLNFLLQGSSQFSSDDAVAAIVEENITHNSQD